MNQKGDDNIAREVSEEKGKQEKENRKAKDRKDKKKEASEV